MEVPSLKTCISVTDPQLIAGRVPMLLLQCENRGQEAQHPAWHLQDARSLADGLPKIPGQAGQHGIKLL